jgi:hypothetical protein
MELLQSEADHLLALPKHLDDLQAISFGLTEPFQSEYSLFSADRRELFSLALERGNRRRARLKFQTRARKIVVLARLDIAGRPHRNPPSAPYRPNERFEGTHLHVFSEKFGDRVAFLPEEVSKFVVPVQLSDENWLTAFLDFCNVVEPRRIQLAI